MGEAEGEGEAKVRTGGKPADDPGPSAVYTLADQRHRLAVYSPGAEFKGSVTLSAEGVAYSSDPADAESLDLHRDAAMEAGADVRHLHGPGEALGDPGDDPVAVRVDESVQPDDDRRHRGDGGPDDDPQSDREAPQHAKSRAGPVAPRRAT